MLGNRAQSPQRIIGLLPMPLQTFPGDFSLVNLLHPAGSVDAGSENLPIFRTFGVSAANKRVKRADARLPSLSSRASAGSNQRL